MAKKKSRLEVLGAIEPSRKIWNKCKAHLVYPDGTFKETDASGVFIELPNGKDLTVYFDERFDGEGIPITSMSTEESEGGMFEVHPCCSNSIHINVIPYDQFNKKKSEPKS